MTDSSTLHTCSHSHINVAQKRALFLEVLSNFLLKPSFLAFDSAKKLAFSCTKVDFLQD